MLKTTTKIANGLISRPQALYIIPAPTISWESDTTDTMQNLHTLRQLQTQQSGWYPMVDCNCLVCSLIKSDPIFRKPALDQKHPAEGDISTPSQTTTTEEEEEIILVPESFDTSAFTDYPTSELGKRTTKIPDRYIVSTFTEKDLVIKKKKKGKKISMPPQTATTIENTGMGRERKKRCVLRKYMQGKKKTPRTTSSQVLKWMHENESYPYPNEEKIGEFMKIDGLTRGQIAQFLTNQRKRIPQFNGRDRKSDLPESE